MSEGESPASASAFLMQRSMPSALGAVMWVASEFEAKPATSAYILAPLALALSYSSRMTVPAPSPTTMPSRLLSKGLGASAGSSARLVWKSASNTPTESGENSSAPPQSMTFSRPSSIMSRP